MPLGLPVSLLGQKNRPDSAEPGRVSV